MAVLGFIFASPSFSSSSFFFLVWYSLGYKCHFCYSHSMSQLVKLKQEKKEQETLLSAKMSHFNWACVNLCLRLEYGLIIETSVHMLYENVLDC